MNKIFFINKAINPLIFFILIGLYFSTLAVAAILTVTAIDHRIPSGAAECFSSQTGGQLNNDRTEDLRDVIWSHDGTMVFTINKIMQLELDLSMNKVRDPFELKTVKTFPVDDISHTCDDIDGFDVNHADFQAQGMAAEADQYRAIHIAQKGKIFYIMSNSSEVHRYDLSIPYDFRTAVYKHEFDFDDSSVGGFSISKDGTKMYSLDAADNTPTLKTFSLSPAFDITSATEIHSVDLFTIGVDAVEGEDLSARDIEFNNDGSQMFISVFNSSDTTDNKIHQFSLGKNYDVSTATDLGNHTIVYSDIGTGAGISWGFSFSSDGMKLFVVQLATPGSRVDQIHQFDLECPYGVVSCSSDASASVISQVELANQNISLNVSTIFKRFEWIKRNRNNEDLTSHNIDINYPNPLLKSLVSKFEPSLKNNLAALVSNTQKKEKKEKKEKSKWSSWSIVDLSMGDYEETLLDKAKGIRTKGITLGSDRKIGDNKFLGLALRYGNGTSNIRRTFQNVDLESLTLNLYGIVPTNNNQYINTVLGLSALRYDNKYLGKLSGERNGKQAFASINYRTKNTYSKFNITPTGKLTYGVTELSEFTDFISKAKDRPATNIRFHKDTFVSGEFAGGLLFEMDKIEREGETIQPMGGIEIIYDLTDDITYKYQNVGSTSVNKETINKYSNKKLKTNIALEHIVENGLTILFDYQNIISLDDCTECINSGASRNFNNETLIIKISKSKEDNTQFAFDFDPLSDNLAKLSYTKNTNDFNLKFSSNMNLFTRIPDYGANIQISNIF